MSKSKNFTPAEIRAVMSRAELLHDKHAVEAAIAKVGAEITEKLGDSDPIFMCVMQGAVVFLGNLLPYCQFPLQIDYLHASRYQGATTGGKLDWTVHPINDLKDRTIVIVDDILDEGVTLAEIIGYCKQRGAKEVYTCVLVDKKRSRKPEAVQTADFTGLYVEDYYVFGYGMDYHEYLRNASGIYAVANGDQ